MKKTVALTMIAPLCLLWGCSSAPAGPYGYTASYLEARARCASGVKPDQEQVDRFIRFYDQLRHGRIDQEMDKVYAEDVYFNDTLITLNHREALREHLQGTADNLDSMSVNLLDVLQPSSTLHAVNQSANQRQPEATYLLWEMQARFRLMGKDRLSHTLGISQLCFNEKGQVTFHQDFWDSSQGLDQHLPILGPPTRWLRKHPDTP